MAQIVLRDMLGREVINKEGRGTDETLSLSGFKSGVYLLEVTTSRGVTKKKVVVRRD